MYYPTGEVNLGALNPSGVQVQQLPDLIRQQQSQQNQVQQQSLANQSQANIYATQVLSAATSTGNQQLYDSAKQHLGQMGVDTSMWAPDVQSGATQAQAARLAQSPLGSLLNAGAKMDANTIAANTAAGKATQNPNATQYAMMRGSILSSKGPQAAALFDSAVQSGKVPGLSASDMQQGAQGGGSMPPDTVQPAGAASKLPPSLPQQGAATPQAAPQQQTQYLDKNGSTPTNFVQPPNDPTLTQQGNQQAYQQALDTWQNNPLVKAAQSQGTKTGELTAQDVEAANKAQELTDRLKQNLQAMLKINDQVPSQGLLPSSFTTYGQQAIDAYTPGSKGPFADKVSAAHQWDQINNQQTISEIQQFMASGGSNTRINQTLDKIVQSASGISRDIPPDARKSMIENALAEIGNKGISAQNIAAKQQGQSAQPYQPVPAQVGDAPTYKPGLIRNGYVFKGGDPTQQSSWQKVQ